MPEAEYASPAKKKAAKTRPAPAEAAEQSTEDDSPKKKSRLAAECIEVSKTSEIKERMTVWYRGTTTWTCQNKRQMTTRYK